MPSLRTIVLNAQVVTPESFAPFGAVPSDEGSATDRAEAEFLWNDGCVNFISHDRAEVTEGDIGLRCTLLNRHDTHTQTLMPMDTDAVIVVAAASVDFANDQDLDEVQAFRLRRYQCVHLWRGTWHWGPYPIGSRSVRLLNVQGRGYPRDNGVVQFDDAARCALRGGCLRVTDVCVLGDLWRTTQTAATPLRSPLPAIAALAAGDDPPREQHRRRNSGENDRFDRLDSQRFAPFAAPSLGGP